MLGKHQIVVDLHQTPLSWNKKILYYYLIIFNKNVNNRKKSRVAVPKRENFQKLY